MRRDDVIRLARKAGFQSAEFWPDDFQGLFGCVERFAELVIKEYTQDKPITDPVEIRRVFEIDQADYPPEESGFAKL